MSFVLAARTIALRSRPGWPPALIGYNAAEPSNLKLKYPSASEFRGTDRFRVVRQIGAGGFGVVYEAVDRQRSARVALKIFHSSEAAQLYRLKKEFRALAEISHPNLVSLYELLSDGGHWFFTMELVDGTDFVRFVRGAGAKTVRQELLTRQELETTDDPGPGDQDLPPVNFRRLRDALTQLANGLTYLHSLGKLHRDIKSANVLVTAEGRVVVLDFGLVTEVAQDSAEQSMNLVGTPAYIAPEQLDGMAATPAADWYTVGVLIFQALTGRYPFIGKALEVCQAKRDQEPPRPSDFAANVPDNLNALCHSLLARIRRNVRAQRSSSLGSTPGIGPLRRSSLHHTSSLRGRRSSGGGRSWHRSKLRTRRRDRGRRRPCTSMERPA